MKRFDLPSAVVTILMGDSEQCTYAELDSRFLQELEALNISEAEQDTLFGLWLAILDHEPSGRRALTFDEQKLLFPVLQKMIKRHGFHRVQS